MHIAKSRISKKDGKFGSHQLVFVGEHEPDISSGILNFPVEIECKGGDYAFIILLSEQEARKICGYLDRMGFNNNASQSLQP